MNRRMKDMLSELRAEGHAVVVFTPDELGDCPADTLESHLVSKGNEYIGWHENQYDDSLDGDHDSALASAGWGMDEDYRYYGED